MKQAYLLLGEVLRPQGIKGEVKVHHYSGSPEHFLTLKTVYFNNNGEYSPCSVTGARLQKNDLYLHLEGVPDRNAAEALRGKELWIARSDARELETGENFIAELIGTRAFYTDGEAFGELKEVISTGHVDVYVFSVPGGEWSIPALKAVLPEVSPERILVSREKLQEVGLYEDRHS